MERACSNCVPDKVAWEVHFSIVILMPLYSWFNARSLSFDRKYCSFSPQLCAPQRNHSQLSNWIEQFKEYFFFFYCELWVLIWETFRGYKHIQGILFQFILDNLQYHWSPHVNICGVRIYSMHLFLMETCSSKWQAGVRDGS